MNKNSLLIIGKTPPPIGGVTVHIERLLYNLRLEGIPFESMSLSLRTLGKFIPVYFRSRIIHLNISSVYLRALLTATSRILNKKHINTYHGNLGNKSRIKNIFDIISISLASCPVVLNDEARGFALKYNRKTIMISAFIPPAIEENLRGEIKEKIDQLRHGYKTLYCTNAFGVMYDHRKREIYGISHLADVFSGLCDKALIISDPSASYKNYFERNNIKLTDNVLIIAEPHSFVEVLKLSDCYIRNTTTDGDSLSVKEALFLKKNVIATNCVRRPEGVRLCSVNNPESLLREIELGLSIPIVNSVGNGYLDLKKIYESMNQRGILYEANNTGLKEG